MKEIKTKVENVSAKLKMNGNGWAVVAHLFEDDNVFLQEVKRTFRVVDEFHSTYTRIKLKVNAWKSKLFHILPVPPRNKSMVLNRRFQPPKQTPAPCAVEMRL